MNVAPEAKERLRSLRTLGVFKAVRCYRHLGPKGPEASVVRDRLSPNGSRSGDPHLQSRVVHYPAKKNLTKKPKSGKIR